MIESGILQLPLQPDRRRRCPACGRRRALTHQRRETHGVVGHVDFYRCTYCDHECEYAEKLPPQAL